MEKDKILRYLRNLIISHQKSVLRKVTEEKAGRDIMNKTCDHKKN
jgi:hypothetical protein